jgi:hypothetical protein
MQTSSAPAAEAHHRAPAASSLVSAQPASGVLARATADGPASSQVAVLMLADMAPGAMLWGWSRLVRGPRALRHVPGLRFARVLGSGHEGRFGLRPSATLHGLFLLFDDEATADAFLETSPVAAGYRSHAREWCSAKLRAYSSRGSWGGVQLEEALQAPAAGPVVALTRASIRPSKAVAFWRMAPPAQVSLEAAPGCRFAVGLGEAPLLRQATFSLWDSVAAMDAYARSGAHLAAIRAAHKERYFSESMFVRFVPLALQGHWRGQPLGAAQVGAARAVGAHV